MNIAAFVLAAGKSCLIAREKLERREEEGIRSFDIIGPIAGLSMSGRFWSSKKFTFGIETLLIFCPLIRGIKSY